MDIPQQSREEEQHSLKADHNNAQGLHSATPSHNESTLVHIEVAANFQIACKNIQKWIVESQLRREQIVGISANETITEDGEAVLSVVYKRHSDASMTSLQDIQFTLVSSVKSWDEQYTSAIETLNAQRSDIVALTHTPRNLGQINIQIFWYLTPT